MDNKRRRKEAKASTNDTEEVSSIEWELIKMTDQEEDLIYRMYRLVGDSWQRGERGFLINSNLEMNMWALIAGRIPGRKPEEIERFWIMRHREGFEEKSKSSNASNSFLH